MLLQTFFYLNRSLPEIIIHSCSRSKKSTTFVCIAKPIFSDMKKKDKDPEKYNVTTPINEPMLEYSRETAMAFSPPLTDEELENSMSTDEFKKF